MPTADVNGITINYLLETPNTTSESGGDYIVLINGLADDLQTWDAQVPHLLAKGYNVIRYDNRGIGRSSKPLGPYTAELMAQDLHLLLIALETKRFHLLGVSMGGMIAQSYALAYPNGSSKADGLEMLSLSLCCTYAQPTAFCQRMFGLWADMAQRMSVQDVMRDVTLWAFTVPFFRKRTDELEEVEQAMRQLDISLEAYLAQLNVIQQFDTTRPLEARKGGGLGGLDDGQIMVLAGEEDILIPVQLSRELAELIPGSVFETTRGGHGCMVSLPPWVVCMQWRC